MNPTESSTHDWFREQIGVFVAGGLPEEQRAAFEKHRSECDSCATVYQEALDTDHSLRKLFAGAQPTPGFEDRIVARLREAPQRRFHLRFRGRICEIHPMVRRAAGAVAAAVILGSVGYAANLAIENQALPTPQQVAEGGVFHRRQASVRYATAGYVDLEKSETSARQREKTVTYQDGDGTWDAPSRMAEAQKSKLASNLRGETTEAEAYYDDFNGKLGADKKARERWGVTDEKDGRKTQDKVVNEDYRAHGIAPSTPAPAAGPAPGLAATGTGTLTIGDGITTNGALSISSYSGGTTITAGAVPLSGSEVAGSGKGGGGGGGGWSYGVGQKQLEGVSNQLSEVSKLQTSANNETQALERGLSVLPPGQPGQQQGQQAGQNMANAGAYKYNQSAADPAKPSVGYFRPGDAIHDELKKTAEEAPAGPKGNAVAERVGREVMETQNRLAPDRSDSRRADVGGSDNKPAGTPPVEPAVALADPNQPAPPPPVQPPPASPAQLARKIIRNGQMEFEVDSFDSSFVSISRIAGEEGGFVASTDSEKLPNGKVKGTIVVRVPPDHLDVLVLKLRALGELKSQRISAQDVTKQYTDIESQLRAGRAMEERLLEIIKTSKGAIKDLLEAEKQLGVWRQKIEQLEGEIRYYNNLISLSTLSITMYERDIKNAAFAAETENVNMGVETAEVETAYGQAQKAIADAKGRIIQAELKQYEGGQLAGRIVAEVAPDAAGPLIDRFKQLGKVARLDIDRQQTTSAGATAPPGIKVERKDTRFTVSMYNLANIQPRHSVQVNLAAEDVEKAYRAILTKVQAIENARVVSSNLSRPRADQVTASLYVEIPAAQAEAVLADVRGQGEVMRLIRSENPDTPNVTAAKQGFNVSLSSLATVAPRQTTSMTVAAGDVPTAYEQILTVLRQKNARMLQSQLNQQDRRNVSAVLDFEVPRADAADVEKTIDAAGVRISRQFAQSSDTENTVDTKVRFQLGLVSEEQLQPRESNAITAVARSVPEAYQAILAAAQKAGGRVYDSRLNEQDPRNVTAVLSFDVPRDKEESVRQVMKSSAEATSQSSTRAQDAQNTVDTKVRYSLNLYAAEQLSPRQTWAMGLQVNDVDKAMAELRKTAVAAGGREVEGSQKTRSQNGQVLARMVIEVPLLKATEVHMAVSGLGRELSSQRSDNPNVPDTSVTKARFEVTMATEDPIVGADSGVWAAIKSGLSTSARGLFFSLQWIVVGLLFVVPWVLLIWGGLKLLGRSRSKAPTTPTA